MGLYDDRLADLSESRRVASRGPFAPARPVVRGVVQPPAREKPSMDVQSLLFDRSAGWTQAKAKAWAKSHGYRHGKVHVTDQYVRIRQFDPKGLKVKRTITFGHGIRAVVAREEENMGAKRRRHRSTAKKAAHRTRRRAREVAAPVATEAKRRRRHRRAREAAPVATEAKRRKRRRHRKTREAAPVATEAKRRKRRRHRKTRESRRPVSGQVMEAKRRKRSKRSHVRKGTKAARRAAAKKGWAKRRRARHKFIGPMKRGYTKAAEARRPRRRRHRAREVSEVSEARRHRRKRGRRHHRGMFEARRSGPGRSNYVAELALAIGTGSFAYIVANGLDRFLATYNPHEDPTKLPKHKFTSDGAGTLANALNIGAHPSWLRIGAGIAMAAAPAGASVFVKHPLLRSSLEGAAVGASVQLIQMLWSNVVVPLLAPKDTTDAGLKTSFIARLYPTEIAASINMKAQTTALTGGHATGLSGAPAADAPAPAAGVGQPDVGPFALQGPSPYPSAVEALRAAAGVGGEANRLETGIGYPTVQELWRQAAGGDTSAGFRPSVQDTLVRATTAVLSLAPAVQAAMPGATPAQAEQVAVTALTQPNDIPGAIQQVFPAMPEEHRQEFGRRLHQHVHHHHRRMRGGDEGGMTPTPPIEPGAPPPPGEMFGGLTEEVRRRFPHLRHEHHMQIAGHILTEPHNIVGALKRALPNEPEHVLKEHAKHLHKHVAHVAEAVAPGAPRPPAPPPPPPPAPEHLAGVGASYGDIVSILNSVAPELTPAHTQQIAQTLADQPWNIQGAFQQALPNYSYQQHQDYARRFYSPYMRYAGSRPAPPVPRPGPPHSLHGMGQPPPLPNPGPPDMPVPGPNGQPAGESCGCGDNDMFLGLAGNEGEAAKEDDRLIVG